MTKEQKPNKRTDLKEKLLKSTAISSLNQELFIYDKFEKLGWNTEHSPYYLDPISGKFREVDVSARKYWNKGGKKKFSFGINFIVECKTINNYHIVVCNEQKPETGSYLENNWIGDDGSKNYPKTIKLLEKHNIKSHDIQEILKKFHKHLFPKKIIRYYDYKLDSFEIPVYCSFRETNIGTTKETENSVVWKAYQSLYSCIRFHQESAWEDIDYELYNIENEVLISTYEAKLENLKNTLIDASTHFEITHPVLVVDSMLWELKNNDLNELKYCRLIFQEMYGFETWIDIVTYDHLDKYLLKSKLYDDFFTVNGFKNENGSS